MTKKEIKMNIDPNVLEQLIDNFNKGNNGSIGFTGIWTIDCLDKFGNLKWTHTEKNLVVNVGLDHILDVTFVGGTPVDPWYVGLIDGGSSAITVAAADTLASHAGWTEFVNYTTTGDVDDQRIEYDNAAVSSQSTTNSATKAEFKIDTAAQTIGGAFLCVTLNRTLTTGILFSAVAFTGAEKSADADDVLQVTYTLSAADDGV